MPDKPTDIPVGEMVKINEDGHLMRTHQRTWEYAASAFARACHLNRRQAQEVLNDDNAAKR